MTKRNSALSALTRRNMLLGFSALGAASVFAACGVPAPTAQPEQAADEKAAGKDRR